MERPILRRLVAVAVLTAALGCGGGGSTSGNPTAPPVPQVLSLAGSWQLTEVVTPSGVSGGECVGATVIAAGGITVVGTMTIQQNSSSLTFTSVTNTGQVSSLGTGTAGPSSFTLSVTPTSVPLVQGFVCVNGNTRDVRLTNSTMTGTVAGSAMSGTFVEVYAVLLPGTSTTVGTLTLQASVTGTRQQGVHEPSTDLADQCETCRTQGSVSFMMSRVFGT